MKQLALAGLICLIEHVPIAGQINFTVSGFVHDFQNGEPLINVVVYDSLLRKGTYTNEHGFYSFAIPKGLLSLRISILGFETQRVTFSLDRDTILHISMRGSVLKTVEVRGKSKFERDVLLGRMEMTSERLKNIPSIFLGYDVSQDGDALPYYQFLVLGLQSLCC